jgi:DNA-binding NarL/FixJ family response regulator
MERVMIVEDHSAFAQALDLVLGKTDGTQVVLARTLEEGRAMIRGGERFDLIMLDLTAKELSLSRRSGSGARRRQSPYSAPGTTSTRPPRRPAPTLRSPKRRPCPT